MHSSTIVVAGATGNLGGRIARALLERGASVRGLVRHGTARDKLERLQELGVTIARVDMGSASQLTPACSCASCVVSALQGLRDVIVETQTGLLDAAIEARVPRFIPSDYSIDFTKFPAGENRNLDLRREFHQRLDKAPIRATTIFNGAFADLLAGQMPLILFKLKRVLYWGDVDQRMDFTTMNDTAAFTASAALDPYTPRFLRISGDQLSARELTAVVSEVTGKKFRLFRAGGLEILGTLIKVARAVAPGEKELYPAWQGMQYMRNMFEGRAKLEPLDNDRYSNIRCTSVRDVLSARQVSWPARRQELGGRRNDSRRAQAPRRSLRFFRDGELQKEFTGCITTKPCFCLVAKLQVTTTVTRHACGRVLDLRPDMAILSVRANIQELSDFALP
jgi:nucleoside-diphosphate-sugar epimerase